MAVIRTIKDFEAWQTARELAREVYSLPRDHPMMRDYAFRDQLLRACVSTMSNVAEAHGRGTPADKARFLDFARGSGNESLSMFYLGEDIGHFSSKEAERLKRINRIALGQITQLAKYLRNSKRG